MPDRHILPMAHTTEFFRDFSLAYAADHLFPQVARKLGRRILIAEVGCSSGEETWSLAAILKHQGVSFHIDAYDADASGFKKANSRTYPCAAEALRANCKQYDVPAGVLRYFPGVRTLKHDDPVTVAASLRPHVKFIQQDLWNSPLSSSRRYDIVTAYNFLYYYYLKGQDRLLTNMLAGLRYDGYFIRDRHQSRDSRWWSLTRHHGLAHIYATPEPATTFKLRRPR